MIVWKGKGILSFFALLAGVAINFGLAGAIPQLRFLKEFNTGIIVALVLGAFFNWLMVSVIPFTKDDPDKVLIDPQTNQPVKFNMQGTFMFLPRAYWTFIYLGLAVLPFILKLVAKK